jgi:hypothetical protein
MTYSRLLVDLSTPVVVDRTYIKNSNTSSSIEANNART